MTTLSFLLIFGSLFGVYEIQSMAVDPINLALLNFDKVTKCMLGYTALHYNGYGCYCGRGGSGIPIDGIDTCCMHHDHCYEKAVESGACSSTIWEYINLYDWSCVNSTA
ncbi:phospholipase A2 [Oesophagostomum dentatum]|uniref:Phospholipase A2 n=1 Tax=Oesophagostomum dentatum TaxID=61180 RepID=A0A0B1S2L0_OESDE|nr:phospholipase A2 [Oesophagostomum dentatum]